jgi:methylated-DNA-[protein]-cysteine S-methyltransferase
MNGNIKKNIKKVTISTYAYKNLYFAVGVLNGKIIGVSLPKCSELDALNEIADRCESMQFEVSDKYLELAEKVCAAFHGEKIKFNLKNLDLEVKSEGSPVKTSFERDVLMEVAKIPYGEIRTYKQIASAIETKGYQAVGTAVGKNPFPIIIPCHRVVKSDLRVGEYRGGSEMKNEILKNEGIQIEHGKIKKDN